MVIRTVEGVAMMANGSRSVWEQMIMASFTLALVMRFGNVAGSVVGLRFCYEVVPYAW
jgi:hypothetical protein